MADAPKPEQGDEKRRKALAAEADGRIADARRQKSEVELDLREAYFFTKPRLSRSVRSGQVESRRVEQDADELATGIGTEVNEDFATELINAFMPPHFDWCRSQAGVGIPDAVWDTVKGQAVKNDAEIFKAIRSSNFDAELAMALVPEGGIGTIALWVHWPRAHDPIVVQHVPLRELEINVGPEGGIDDRFIVRFVKKRSLPSVLPNITVPKKIAKEKKDNDWVEVRWCYWRDWSKPGDVVWKHVVQLDGVVVYDEEYQGEGSCPLIVMRFAPDSLHAFGNGPTIDSLPMLRVVDTIAAATQDRVDIAVNPPFAYPDDGVLSFEGGIRAGMGYPKRPGAGEIEKLYFEGDPNLGFYTLADLEKSIKRKHFADYPDQQGKTPPTATQWLDEMIKSQRRIGTPGQKFWREGPAEIYLRYRYLLEKGGVIQPLSAEGRSVAVRPYNPAAKAQEQQEVQIGLQVLNVAKNYFPETSQAAIDELKTIENIKEKMGDRLVVLRDEATVTRLVGQVLQAAPQIAQVAGAMKGGGQ